MMPASLKGTKETTVYSWKKSTENTIDFTGSVMHTEGTDSKGNFNYMHIYEIGYH